MTDEGVRTTLARVTEVDQRLAFPRSLDELEAGMTEFIQRLDLANTVLGIKLRTYLGH